MDLKTPPLPKCPKFSTDQHLGFCFDPLPRVDHISKSVSNVDSKLFIPFQYIRIYTKKNFSHIEADLGVPQGGSNFTKGLIRANMLKTLKCSYLAYFRLKGKNKNTFFSSVLKV